MFYVDEVSMNSYNLGMKTIVSEKGQITIPKAIRDKLGIKSGTILDIDNIEGKLVGIKIQPVDAFQKWRGRGKLPNDLKVDEYLNLIRE